VSRNLRSLLIVAVVFAWAGTAQAVSVYGEFLTPDWGVRGTLTADFGYGDLDLSVSGVEKIDGLPDGGLVNPELSYTHHFKPGVSVDSIEGAWLCVGLVDDAYRLRDPDLWNPNEYAEIEIDGQFWKQGSAVLNVLGGSLSIAAFEQDGEFVVTVSSTNSSDFRVAGSLFKVKFNAASAPPIPEPTSAAVFGLGAAVVGIVLLRRRA
jgi:hypothetical protein